MQLGNIFSAINALQCKIIHTYMVLKGSDMTSISYEVSISIVGARSNIDIMEYIMFKRFFSDSTRCNLLRSINHVDNILMMHLLTFSYNFHVIMHDHNKHTCKVTRIQISSTGLFYDYFIDCCVAKIGSDLWKMWKKISW